MEQRIKEIVSRFSKLREGAFSINHSVHTSLNIKSNVKNVLKEKTEENVKNEVNPKEKTIDVLEPPRKKDQTPMMMKKINRHYQELSKNNLKKQKQPFFFHGSIDDYQKELEGKMGLVQSCKEID